MATKWGVISSGKICHDFVTAVQSIPEGGHEFVAIAARDLSSAQEFATNHSIPKAYGSYAQIAKDPNVEVVYVGNINAHHYKVAKLMLEYGKHVLIEKPMTINAKQTKALINVARKQKRFLMEALWSRFFPAYDKIMELIKSGSIGEVVHVDVNFGTHVHNLEKLAKESMGGGSILDIGIYPLNIVTMVYNGEKPKKIAAIGHLIEDGVDISMCCSLLYSNNGTASITTNATVQYPNDCVIIGTKGTIKIPHHFWCPTVVETAEKTFEFPLPGAIRSFNFENSSGLQFEAMAVRECIRKGELESQVMPQKDSETLAELMDEIRHQLGYYFSDEK